MTVLVLTSRTGGGHDVRAEAFRDWVARLYGAAVEVRIDHALENASPWNARGVAFYNAIQRHAPWFHHLYYNIGEIFGAVQRDEVHSYYDSLLHAVRPDVILSVHSMLNQGHFAYAKGRLGPTVFCATYCGEFSGGYGFSRHWVAPAVDLFLGRTEEALRAAQDLGLPAEKGRCLGQLLKPAFYDRPMDGAQRSVYLRDHLGLEPDRFTLLLATGGAAAQDHEVLLQQLLPLSERLQVISLCGRSVPARRERLETWRQAHPALRLIVLPFSEEMDRLLQVTSVVVTRPGTTTSAEALRLGCPIIFNRIGGTMPQELCTLRYFRARGLANEIRSAARLARILETWLNRPLEYRRYRGRFRALRPKDDPEALIRAIIGPRLSAVGVGPRQGSQAL
jgi:processive 1,2-diacylglycerol beta-glucosyltransferase